MTWFRDLKIASKLSTALAIVKRLAIGDTTRSFSACGADGVGELLSAMEATTESLGEVTRACQSLEAGRLDVEVRARFEHDELMRALAAVVAASQQVSRLVPEIAAGNPPAKIRPGSGADERMQALGMMVKRLTDIVIEVRGSAHNFRAGGVPVRTGGVGEAFEAHPAPRAGETQGDMS